MWLRRYQWSKVRDPRYLVQAGVGVGLMAIAQVSGDQGWWPHVMEFVGVGLVVWPILPDPARPRKK